MKNVLFAVFGIFSVLPLCHGQVGINTANPVADLEIVSKTPPATGEFNGIIVPKVAALPAVVGPSGLVVYLTTQDGANNPGLYFSNGTVYINVTDMAAATGAFVNYGTTVTATTATANVSRSGTVNIGPESFRTGMLNVENNLTSAGTTHSSLRLVNSNTGTSVTNTHGIYTENTSTTGGIKYGIRNEVTAAGLGNHVGIRNVVSDNSNATTGGSVIGIDNIIGQVTGTGSGIANYGLRSVIGNASSTGPIYGIYSEATGTTANNDVYGALINGRLSIGNLARTTGYDFPTNRGIAGQVLTTNGAGLSTWSDLPAVADVSDNNEGILTVAAGGTNDSRIVSTNGTNSTSVTIAGGDGINVTESGNIINIATTNTVTKTINTLIGGPSGNATPVGDRYYLRLNPNGANIEFLLPDPTTVPGRTYVLYNISENTSAIIYQPNVSLGNAFKASNAITTTNSITLNPNNSSKTINVFSDGFFWIYGAWGF